MKQHYVKFQRCWEVAILNVIPTGAQTGKDTQAQQPQMQISGVNGYIK